MKAIVLAAGLFLFAAPSLAAAAGDAAEGRQVFADSCAKCHSFDPAATDYRGPHLAGLFERRYGAVEGFPYRMVWTAASPRWSRRHLDDYLDIHHLPDPGQRADVIEYLAEATKE